MMRLPWVSRALLDQSLVTLERWITSSTAREDRLHAILDAQNARYEWLLARYHMLKLQGASEAPAAPAMPERPTPDPVTTAINEASAGKDAKVRKAMLEQVKRDRNASLSDTDIIARIQRGNRVADELEPVPSVEPTQNPSVSAAAS